MRAGSRDCPQPSTTGTRAVASGHTPGVSIEAMVIFFEILMAVASVAIFAFAIFVMYRVLTDGQ